MQEEGVSGGITFLVAASFVIGITGLVAVKSGSLFLSILTQSLLGADLFRYFDPFPRRLTSAQEALLQKHIKYYRLLPPHLKKIFGSRLLKFMDEKEFETKAGLTVTEEMKLLVSASAIQLTLGIRNYKLPHFKKIIIFPESYYSKITGHYHKGETNFHGAVVLSWKDFIEGYRVPDDSLNLGLHEFAHALFISFRAKGLDDIHLEENYMQWKNTSSHVFNRMRERKSNYLRPYAATNLMEFFAVCVENFFEEPEEFRQELPELYQSLAKFLGQDPSRLKEKPHQGNKIL